MALSYKHAFVSAKTDGTDASVLRPSDWNAEHTITCATNVILGRNTAGTGAVEELPTSDAVIALLASATLADLLTAMGVSPPTTGDARLTLKTTATTGWLMLNDGTFGNAASGGTARANADTSALFVLLYDNTVDASCAVTTSAGAATTRAAQGSAATAYAAGCRMALPKALGRAFVGAGTGSGLTARALGSAFGGDTHTILTDNLPAYTPAGSITNGAITVGGATALRNVSGDNNNNGGGGGSFGAFGTTAPTLTASQATSTFTGTPQGGTSTAFSIAQASTAWNVMVKL